MARTFEEIMANARHACSHGKLEGIDYVSTLQVAETMCGYLAGEVKALEEKVTHLQRGSSLQMEKP